MSVSALHSSAFYDEVALAQSVWTIEDDAGIPAPPDSDGIRAMPFWSKSTRALRVIENVPAYKLFRVREIPLREFVERWLPGLQVDGIRVGLNWSGARATGFDVEPDAVLARLGKVGHAGSR